MNILIQNPHCTKRSYESLVGNIVLFWVIFPELFISHASCWNFISSRVRRRKPDTIYHKIASDNLVLPRNLHKSRSNQSSPTKKEDFVRRFPLRLRSDNFWGYIFVGGVELPTVIQLLQGRRWTKKVGGDTCYIKKWIWKLKIAIKSTFCHTQQLFFEIFIC